MLKLNEDKTWLIIFTPKYKQDLYNDLSITIGDTVVECSSQVNDLGVIFDRLLSLRQTNTETNKRYVSMFLILQKRVEFTLETLAE